MATRAIVLPEIGSPDNLELRELPDPVAGPGELLIAVEAASIAPVDRGAVETGYGDKMPGPAPWILGWDLAGTVRAVGDGVEPELVGRRVLGFSQWLKGGAGHAGARSWCCPATTWLSSATRSRRPS